MSSLFDIRQSINKHKNMLIMGSGKTNYMLNKVAYFDTYQMVLDNYGESNLSEAFKVAKEFGAPNVFVINVKSSYSYLELMTAIKHNDFTYIVPVDTLLSDYYNDPYRNNSRITYCQFFLEEFGNLNNSTIVVTDKHASLYQDLDAFITEMDGYIKRFNSGLTSRLAGENLLFIANNLVDYPMANVVLASALCSCDINEYPYGKFGPAVFDIDVFDVPGSMAFFKNNTLTSTSVENLLNFRSSGPEKIVTIDRIIKYIKREIDFSDFKGRPFSGYQKLRMEKKLDMFLESLEGYILNDYFIESITPYQDTPGAVTVVNRFDIWPINSLEKCSIETGVDV